MPHFLSYSQKEIAVLLVINVLLVMSYRLMTLTGEWSLVHVVIMGVGAYASALMSKSLGVPVPLSMLLGACTAGAVAALLSFPLFRMKGFYFPDRLVRRRRGDPADLEAVSPTPSADRRA
jgi:branched-chain amino acid transport system permease protein